MYREVDLFLVGESVMRFLRKHGWWLTIAAVLLTIVVIGFRNMPQRDPVDPDARYRITKGWRHGFIDGYGNVVIEPTLDDATAFRNGYAVIEQRGWRKLIDIHGKVVLESDEFEPREPPDEEGLILAVDEDDRYGFVALDGSAVVPFEFAYARSFAGGRALVRRERTGKFGYIDTQGNLVVDFLFNYAGDFAFSRAMVMRDRKYGYIDPQANEVIPLQYEFAGTFCEGLAAVSDSESRDRWCYIDVNGRVVIPGPFKRAHEFHEGLAAVAAPGGAGFIDKGGKLVIDAQFESNGPFSEGLCFAAGKERKSVLAGKLPPQTGYIDKSGKFAITFDPNLISSALGFGDFNGGRTWVYLKDRQGYIDRQRSWVWSCPADNPQLRKQVQIENAEASVKPKDRFWAAIKRGDLVRAKDLIADVPQSALRGEFGYWTAESVIEQGRKDLLELMISHGLDVHFKSDWGATHLHSAVEQPNPVALEMAQLLLAAGADAAATRNDGNTPLHRLAVYQRGESQLTLDLARLLLDAGAPVDGRGFLGRTPLLGAKWREDPALGMFLLSRGANPNAKAENGETPLHYVASVSLAKTLLDAGAQINEQDEQGETPLLIAACVNLELAALLLARGADPDIADREGTTARDQLEYALRQLKPNDPQRLKIESLLPPAPTEEPAEAR
jgi:hypothetical protein